MNHKKMPKSFKKRCNYAHHVGDRYVWVGLFRRNASRPDGLGQWCEKCRRHGRLDRRRRRLQREADVLNTKLNTVLTKMNRVSFGSAPILW